jgi:hypothetical protein
MRKVLVVALAALAAVGAAPREKAAEPTPKQIHIQMRIYEGDPFGSRQDRTLKLLSRPQIMTLDGQMAAITIRTDQTVPKELEGREPGFTIKVRPTLADDNRVRVHLDWEVLSIVHPTGKPAGITIQQQTTDIIAEPREPVRVKLGTSAAGQLQWIELTVEEIKPAN